MGFFSDLAKSLANDVQERAQAVSARKEKFERTYEYRDDDELFRAIARMSPTSVDFAAMSLLLQDRGYSSDEIVQRYKHYK